MDSRDAENTQCKHLPSPGREPMQISIVKEGDTWMKPYRHYLVDGILPLEPAEAKKIKRNSTKYTLVDGSC